jgi:hypothetical protein
MAIHLPPDIEKEAREAAERQGLDVSAFVTAAVEEKLRTVADTAGEPSTSPNLPALRALEQIRRSYEGWPETSGAETQRMLREGRDGGIYGLGPSSE